jgi:glycosyltransferase involved in cell wall biosynthesis
MSNEKGWGDDRQAQRPTVSVVIPTYGRNEYLTRAVQSVVAQTYDDIELLVVDDGSPSPVAQTLEDVALDTLEAVTFIRHSTNRGANVARNTGIRAARGEYVSFLDDDDWWGERKISRQVTALQDGGPEADVAYTGVKAQSPSGSFVTRPTAEGDVMKELLTGTNFGQFSSIMVDTDVIETAGLPDERFPAWQDREWFFRLAQHSHFTAVPETVTYRQTGLPDSITKNFEAKRDVAYPLFVKKHRSVARDHGLYYERTFLASLRRSLARSAIRAERYEDARTYFLLAFLANPLYRPVYVHLLASLGGKWTYKLASLVRQKMAIG